MLGIQSRRVLEKLDWKLAGLPQLQRSDLANTLVHEICKNIFRHAFPKRKVETGLLGLRVKPHLKTTRGQRYLKRISDDAIREFMWANRSNDLIELSVVDSGVGIYETLKDTMGNLSEEDVLIHAFDDGSTKDDPEEEIDDPTLGKGLHWVKQHATSGWNGLIYVRSGRHYVVFSSSYPDGRKSDSTRPYLPGVQFRIYLPICDRQHELQYVMGEEGDRSAHLVYSSLPSRRQEGPPFRQKKIPVYLDLAKDYDDAIISLDIPKVAHTVRKTMSSGIQKLRAGEYIVGDLFRIAPFSVGMRGIYSVFVNLINELVNDEADELPLVLANGERTVVEGLKSHAALNSLLSARGWAVPVVDIIGGVHWLGTDDAETKLLDTLLDDEIPNNHTTTGTLEDIANRNTWMFKLEETDTSGSTWTTSFQLRDIRDLTKREVSSFLMKKFDFLGVHHKGGHYELLSGIHTEDYFELRLISGDREVERIAAKELFKLSPRRLDSIVTFGLPGLLISRRLKQLFRENLGIDPPVHVAHDYEVPHFQAPPSNLGNTLLVLDVASTGLLFKALTRLVEHASGGKIIGSVCLIDVNHAATHAGAKSVVSVESNCYEPDGCPQCKKKVAKERIDRFTMSPWTEEELAIPVEQTDKPCVLSAAEFWNLVTKTGAAVKGHIEYNGLHFPLFIDTLKMFKDDETLNTIAETIARRYRRASIDVLVYPAHETAAILAQAVADLLRIPHLVDAVKDIRRGEFRISKVLQPDLLGATGVLVLDDGANHGNTMQALADAVEEAGARNVEYCVFLNRLWGLPAKQLRHMTSDNQRFHFLFRMVKPRVYRPRDCPLCKKRQLLELQRRTCKEDQRGIREMLTERIKGLEVKPWSDQ